MKLHTTLKTACLFTFIALGACDPEIDGVAREDEDARTAVDGSSVSVADKIVEARDAADAGTPSDELSLAFTEAVDPSSGSCWQGQVQANWLPSGTCGGCKIQNVYPGQKYVESYRVCNGGTWSPWYNGGSECVDC